MLDIKELNIPNVCFTLEDESDSNERLEKFKQQRIERGFDDSETWALFATIASFIIPRLERFIEVGTKVLFPASLDSSDEWVEICKKMLNAFKLIASDDYQDSDVDEGLELFHKYFKHLWW